MDKDTYYHFVDELINAKTVAVKGFEDSKVLKLVCLLKAWQKRCTDACVWSFKPKGLIDHKTANALCSVTIKAGRCGFFI